MVRLFLMSLVCFVAFVLPAQAAQPRFIQAYGDWDTYVFTEDGNKVCYMASRPKKSEGDYSRRGEVYAYVTHRPGEGTEDVFGYVTGYTYKTGADVHVVIDGDKTTLFTQEDKAWALDESSDKALAKAIQKGSSMVVNGVSSRGTKTKDIFSLSGSGKAYAAISKACGI